MNWKIFGSWKFSNKSENFPLSNFSENFEISFIRDCKCANFQTALRRWTFFNKITWIRTFAEGEDFFDKSGNFQLYQLWAKMEKVENFPIWKNWKIIFQNLMDWIICNRENFSDKSENFPLFQLYQKYRNYFHLGL